MNNDQMWHIELTTLLEHIESLLDTDTISGAIQLCLDNQEYVLKNIMLLVRIHEIVSPHDPLYQVLTCNIKTSCFRFQQIACYNINSFITFIVVVYVSVW